MDLRAVDFETQCIAFVDGSLRIERYDELGTERVEIDGAERRELGAKLGGRLVRHIHVLLAAEPLGELRRRREHAERIVLLRSVEPRILERLGTNAGDEQPAVRGRR